MTSIVIAIVIFDVIVVVVAIFADKITDSKSTIDPYYDDAIRIFDSNKKALDQIDISSHKLGSGHLYE